MRIRAICIGAFLLLYPIILFAQDMGRGPLAKEERDILIQETLERFQQQQYVVDKGVAVSAKESNTVIAKALRDISTELTLEYLIPAYGEQTFEIVVDGVKLSRLDYPLRGRMLIFRGEVGFLSKFFLNARYGNSSFHEKICSDEDWGMWGWHNGLWKYIEYQITKQNSKSKVELFDVNLCYRLWDLGEDEIEPKRMLSHKESIFDYLLIDRLSLDIFAGYQSQKGRYSMLDPMTEKWRILDGSWWYAVGLPADIGLNSFYKIHYKGPRLGLRAEASKGKVISRLSFAYAWLETKAYGWWNLRDYSFWQSGNNGYGMNFGAETTYLFTPSLSAGLGYNYFFWRQEKLKESGIQPGSTFDDLDIVRNANSKIYGFSFILRYIW